MRRAGSRASGLAALLDALEQDLLAASVEEIQDAQRETGRARQAACHEVRSLLREAVAASEDEAVGVSPSDIVARDSLHRH